MHAISPQMMVWDPSSVGVPAQAGDMQAPMFSSTYPTVIHSHPYRIPETAHQIFAGATVQSPIEPHQGLVWIQQPQMFAPDEIDTQAPIVTQGLVPGQMTMQQQQGMVPVIMSINGQRFLVHKPVTQVPTPQPGYCHIAQETTQHEGVHLVNIAGINQRMQQGVHIAAPMQHDPRQQTMPPAQIHEKPSGPFDRPRLIPKRRNGNNFSVCDNAMSWRRVSDERTLVGLNTAIRRRSQSADQDPNSEDAANIMSGTPSPNKRIATTFCTTADGFEIQSEFWRAPDARVMRKLIDIIEYYFSDECLSKNGYMLKQLSSGEGDGYISLRRVAALKRVKSQTRDLRTVAYAVQQSTKLEMDEEGTMIRRKRPLPDNIEAPRFIRSVLAINLPKDSPSVEDVTGLFTPYGELTQVRVLRPGKTIPSYLKDYTAWVPDLGNRVCAVVEFENQDEAQKACREINMQNRGQKSLRVALLKPGARIRRTLYRKYKDDNAEAEKQSDVARQDDVATENIRARCLSDSSEGSANHELSSRMASNKNINNNKSFHYDASGSGSDTGSDTDSVGSKSGNCRVPPKLLSTSESRRKCTNTADSGYSQSSSSDERESIISSPPLRRNSNVTKSGNDTGASPVSRRTSPVQKKFIDGVPVGVERHPKGPSSDSSGFSASRQVSN